MWERKYILPERIFSLTITNICYALCNLSVNCRREYDFSDNYQREHLQKNSQKLDSLFFWLIQDCHVIIVHTIVHEIYEQRYLPINCQGMIFPPLNLNILHVTYVPETYADLVLFWTCRLFHIACKELWVLQGDFFRCEISHLCFVPLFHTLCKHTIYAVHLL